MQDDRAGRAEAMLSSTTTMEVGIDIGALRAGPFIQARTNAGTAQCNLSGGAQRPKARATEQSIFFRAHALARG
jgi:hypothetical protein